MSDSGLTKAFEEHKVIPDVLKSGTDITRNLHVKWNDVTLDKPGQRLDREAVQGQPSLTVIPKLDDNDSSASYVLLMVDPDLTRYNDTTFGQVRHWFVPKCKVLADGNVQDGEQTDVSPYVGPAPLPAHLLIGKDRPSRYTFVLLRHTSGDAPATYDIERLKKEYEGEPGALGGESQNIVDRWKFNTQNFIEQNGLSVVAATFMFVEGNAKSGATNVGLLAQGVAEKAVGK